MRFHDMLKRFLSVFTTNEHKITTFLTLHYTECKNRLFVLVTVDLKSYLKCYVIYSYHPALLKC